MDNRNLKMHLLSEGLIVAPALFQKLQEWGFKLPNQVRSGASGGLDLKLSKEYPLNVPISGSSGFELHEENSKFYLNCSGMAVPVELVRRPAFYDNVIEAKPLHRLVQLCFDRLSIGIYNACVFDCGFCSIKTNAPNDNVNKNPDEIVCAVQMAMQDATVDIRHFMLGGGTDRTESRSAERIVQTARKIRDAGYRQPIYAMLVPPKDYGFLDAVFDAGVDEVALNIELWDIDARKRFMPRKDKAVSREEYLRALEYTVSKIGPINTRTIFVVGLEPANTLLQGIEAVVSMGVMPILSVFRPLNETPLAQHPAPSVDFLKEVYDRAFAVCSKKGIPIGPVCIDCQNNVLAFPEDFTQQYRFY